MTTGNATSCNSGGGCTFVYHSVVPPTHCPNCGKCLGCGQGFTPYNPYPWHGPRWYPGYPYSFTYTNTTTGMSPGYGSVGQSGTSVG